MRNDKNGTGGGGGDGRSGPKRSRGRPSKEDGAAIREELLNAARVVFSEVGYGDASADQIAARAGVTKRTFYRYFADKGAALEAVSRQDLSRFEAALPTALATPDVDTALREIASALLDLWTGPLPATTRMIYAEGTRFPHLADILRETSRRAVQRVEEVLRRHGGEKVDTHMAAQTFVRMVFMAPQEWLLLRPLEEYPAPERNLAIETIQKLFVRFWKEAFKK